MEAAELDAYLRAGKWALLSTAAGAQPYAVPVSYGWNGRVFYLACSPGRKLRNIEENPLVCMTLTEVVGPDDWRCAVVSGRAQPVDNLAEHVRALRLIARQRSGATRLSAGDAARAAKARVIRIVPTELSGRVRGGLFLHGGRETADRGDGKSLTDVAKVGA
jgi:nitroimidazol reductase NimA-like FMN-containing flavoprotein (pyridoxamine 5'-phosphate oxidase superfamily)